MELAEVEEVLSYLESAHGFEVERRRCGSLADRVVAAELRIGETIFARVVIAFQHNGDGERPGEELVTEFYPGYSVSQEEMDEAVLCLRALANFSRTTRERRIEEVTTFVSANVQLWKTLLS